MKKIEKKLKNDMEETKVYFLGSNIHGIVSITCDDKRGDMYQDFQSKSIKECTRRLVGQVARDR